MRNRVIVVFLSGFFLCALAAGVYVAFYQSQRVVQLGQIPIPCDTSMVLNIKAGVNDETAELSFLNTCDSETVEFWINNPNLPDFRFTDSICAYLNNTSQNDSVKALALWNLLCSVGVHYDFDYEHRLPDNMLPNSLLSFPYFMCGEKAGLFMNIAANCGIKSRIVRLKGHIANEFFYNGKWYFVDADEGVFFTNDAGKVLSAAELATDRSLISKKHIRFASKSNFTFLWWYSKYFTIVNYSDDNTHLFDVDLQYCMPVAFTLHKGDVLTLKWILTNTFQRLKNPRFGTNGFGEWVQNFMPISATANKYGFFATKAQYSAPFFINKVRVVSESKFPSKIYMIYTERLSNKDTIQYIGTVRQGFDLVYKFNAPQKPVIYYHIKLIAISTDNKRAVEKIKVKYGFVFNSEALNIRNGGWVLNANATETSASNQDIQHIDFIRHLNL